MGKILSFVFVAVLILALTFSKSECHVCLKRYTPQVSEHRKIDWETEAVTMPLEDLTELVEEIKFLQGEHDRRCR